MGTQDVMLGPLRLTTALFIDMDPTEVVLIPRVETPTATGGKSYTDGTPRTSQTFKLIPLTYDQRPTVTLAGVERIIDYHLLGLYDAEMAVGDFWMVDDTKYEIIAMSDGHGYETKGLVFRHLPRAARA